MALELALMPFGEDILAPLDAIRAIGGMLHVRPFRVTVRRRVWSGARPGIPGTTKVDTDVVLTNLGADGQIYNVRVRQLTRAEALASGGQFTSRDLKVGPVTPKFAASAFGPAGGFDDANIDPAPTGQAVEIIWIVASTRGTFGIPSGGAIFEKKGEEATYAHYHVYLRQTGRNPT